MKEIRQLADKLIRQDRRALSKAITLVESSLQEDQDRALNLLDIIMPHTGKALRIGISGSPGVGKSTFIECFGQHLIATGERICALTIDPSSKATGGSILGDKTRMPILANEDMAYIRPTPSANLLGGVARRSREVIALCDAAGFDSILIETVGVGQSETNVANMTDCYLLLLQPASGDALQGIKRGIMEMADIVVVNKADGDLLAAAKHSANQLLGALALMPNPMPDWHCPVILCSALEGVGMDKIEQNIKAYIKLAHQNKAFDQKRRAQTQHWLKDETTAQWVDYLKHNREIQAQYTQLSDQIKPGQSPTRMARQFIEKLIVPK